MTSSENGSDVRIFFNLPLGWSLRYHSEHMYIYTSVPTTLKLFCCLCSDDTVANFTILSVPVNLDIII